MRGLVLDKERDKQAMLFIFLISSLSNKYCQFEALNVVSVVRVSGAHRFRC